MTTRIRSAFEREDGRRDELVVRDDLRAGDQPVRADREEIRIARPGAHERDATARREADAAVLDGASVFSIAQQGIVRVAAGGSVPRAVAPGHRPEPRACHQMTTDAEFLYFLTVDGEVRRVAK